MTKALLLDRPWNGSPKSFTMDHTLLGFPIQKQRGKAPTIYSKNYQETYSWFHVLRLLANGKAMQPMQPVPNVLVGQSEIHTVIDCLGKSAKQEQQNPFQKSEANFLWRISTPDLWTLTLTALSINWGGPQNSDAVLSKNRTASLRDESTADNTRPQKLGCTHKHQYRYMHMMYLFMCIIMHDYVLCMYRI